MEPQEVQTADNGKEFADHREFAQVTGMKSFFGRYTIMLFWDHSCVGLFFDKKENDENLIQKIMELLEYRKNISLIISGDVLVGPYLSVYGHPTQCYIGEKISPDELFCLLNALFSKVVVYAGAVTVIFDRASYKGEEHTLDPIRGKRFYREFCYCYTEKTAFGKHVDTDNLAEAGTRCSESTIDKNGFSEIIALIKKLKKLIAEAEDKDYSELSDFLAKREKELFIEDDMYNNCADLTSITIHDGVIGIGKNAFKGCVNLTSVTIPDSVTFIAECAFMSCRSLTSITIPDSVTVIGINAFEDCTSLTSVTIPDGVTAIGEATFRNCRSLTSITIPDSVTDIVQSAFAGCASLTSVTIPDSVTFIGNYAFEGCTGLTSITIPDGVTTIRYNLFKGCTSLTSITIPDSVTIIGINAFEGCTSLTSITIPNSVTIIGSSAFEGCTSLTSITIPDEVTDIENYVFRGCDNITSITIPDSVFGIGDGVFASCSSLTSITIPDNVTFIGEDAFDKCDSLSITAPKGSYAIEYAKAKGIKYIET